MQRTTPEQRIQTVFDDIETTGNAIQCECAAIEADLNTLINDIYNEYKGTWRNSPKIIEEEIFITTKMLKDSRSDNILYIYDKMKHNNWLLTPNIRDDMCPVFKELYFMFQELQIRNTIEIFDERMTIIEGRYSVLNEFAIRMEKLTIVREEFNL